MLEINPGIKMNNELLMFCSEFGYVDLYFFLRNKGLLPNISIYKKSVLGGSLDIVKDISELIGLSNVILKLAFQTNNTNIAMYLLEMAIKEGVKFNTEFINYPLLNNNLPLLNELEKMGLVYWEPELYYSALLSGSMEMIRYVESRLPNIHENHTLDTSNSGSRKGWSTILLLDMIYEVNGKKYFAHTINYAIQSRSLDVVRYIYERGYGIAPSNFITAIKQGTPDILQYLCDKYYKKLPSYLIHYLGINSYITDKQEKARILINSGYLALDSKEPKTIDDYKKESLHLEMIINTTQIQDDNAMDIDFLMNYRLFFVPNKGYKMNNMLLTKVKLCLELGLDDELVKIFMMNHTDHDKQLIADTLYLFGKLPQIKSLYQYVGNLVPSDQIIMEVICYCQLGKLCYLVNNKLLLEHNLKKYHPLVAMLSDKYLDTFFHRLGKFEPEIKYLLMSGNKTKIATLLTERNLGKEDIKVLLMLDDIYLLKKILIPMEYLDELSEWAEKNDLLEIKKYLQTIIHRP
jgi:hypothetical protein